MPELHLNEIRYSRSNGVRNLLFEEQPREKLINHGAETLTDSELLAILIRSGTTEMNVLETARCLLEKSGGLSGMARMKWQEISRIKGIGKVKAITLLAALELSKRLQQADRTNHIQLTSPDKAHDYFGPIMRDLDKEIFIVGYLNAAKQLTGYDKLSQGSSNATIVDVPEIFRMAILNRANSIIVLHNHPSGLKKPSHSDFLLTKKIFDTGKLVGISLVDHLIICGSGYYSFADEGKIG